MSWLTCGYTVSRHLQIYHNQVTTREMGMEYKNARILGRALVVVIDTSRVEVAPAAAASSSVVMERLEVTGMTFVVFSSSYRKIAATCPGGGSTVGLQAAHTPVDDTTMGVALHPMRITWHPRVLYVYEWKTVTRRLQKEKQCSKIAGCDKARMEWMSSKSIILTLFAADTMVFTWQVCSPNVNLLTASCRLLSQYGNVRLVLTNAAK